MRKTKSLIAFTVLQALFTAGVPLVLLFCAYGTTQAGVAYTLLKPRMAKLSAKIAQHEGDLSIEADQAKIVNIENELKAERTAEAVLNALMPLLILVGLLVLCKALENAVIVLSGAVGLTLVSFCLGTLFGILAARQVVGKHKEKGNG